MKVEPDRRVARHFGGVTDDHAAAAGEEEPELVLQAWNHHGNES